MKPSELASHYLRFYGDVWLAMNAPVSLLQFDQRHKQPILLRVCLECIAEGKVLPDPSPKDAILWLANHPEAYADCDAYLASKRGKKTTSPFTDAVVYAYNAEQLLFYNEVLKFLRAELAS